MENIKNLRLQAGATPIQKFLALNIVIAFAFMALIMTAQQAGAESTGTPEIDEKLGEMLPLDTLVITEDGESVALRKLMNEKATILAFVYYTCPGICSPLLNSLAKVVDQVDLEPGKDFQVITVSFDSEDTPEIARAKKKNYFNTFVKRENFPENAWRFLTAKPDAIKKLTTSAGFHYKEEDGEFIHAGTLIILAPDGKIIRYLYGLEYLPFDIKMAVSEAYRGKPGPTITKVLRYCFSYDPAGKKYTLNLLRILGATISLVALCFLAFLVFGGPKRDAFEHFEEKKGS
jgi:protein SCO1/2